VFQQANIATLGLILVGFVSPVACQEKTEIELIEEINRIQYMFMHAQNMVLGTRQLGAIDSQKEALRELLVRKEAVGNSMHEMVKGTPAERIARMEKVLAGLKILEKEFKADILLPHQAQELGYKEFKHLVKLHSGDFARVVTTYYREDFSFSDSQKERLLELRKETGAKRKEITDEYKKKIAELDSETGVKLGKILTPKQRMILEERSGQKLTEQNNKG